MRDESQLSVLKDIRGLLHELKLVFITYSPKNSAILDFHNMLEELSDKISKFPKDSNGMPTSDATVEFRGNSLTYADLLSQHEEIKRELEALIEGDK